MSLYLFDTDILSLYQHDHPAVLQNILLHSADEIVISTISIDEQMTGWFAMAQSAKTPARHEFVATFQIVLVRSWEAFHIVPYTAAAFQRFQTLVKAKLNVGRNDLRIASIALELDATVVTRNRRDFSRVPNLVIVDWTV